MSVWLTWRNDHHGITVASDLLSGLLAWRFPKVLTFFSQYFREIMKELMLQDDFEIGSTPMLSVTRKLQLMCTRHSPPGGIFCHF